MARIVAIPLAMPQATLLVPIALLGIGAAILHPGMGAGLAARRTPRPWQARGHSRLTHPLFGVGLYLSALGLRVVANG